MQVSEGYVVLIVALVYGVYLLVAVFGARVVWRRTQEATKRRRLIVRSLVLAVLFAPVLAGTRIAPFLLGLCALVILDLALVRPLTLSWAAQASVLFAYQMLLPLLVSWAAILITAALLQRARDKRERLQD